MIFRNLFNEGEIKDLVSSIPNIKNILENGKITELEFESGFKIKIHERENDFVIDYQIPGKEWDWFSKTPDRNNLSKTIESIIRLYEKSPTEDSLRGGLKSQIRLLGKFGDYYHPARIIDYVANYMPENEYNELMSRLDEFVK